MPASGNSALNTWRAVARLRTSAMLCYFRVACAPAGGSRRSAWACPPWPGRRGGRAGTQSGPAPGRPRCSLQGRGGRCDPACVHGLRQRNRGAERSMQLPVATDTDAAHRRPADHPSGKSAAACRGSPPTTRFTSASALVTVRVRATGAAACRRCTCREQEQEHPHVCQQCKVEQALGLQLGCPTLLCAGCRRAVPPPPPCSCLRMATSCNMHASDAACKGWRRPGRAIGGTRLSTLLLVSRWAAWAPASERCSDGGYCSTVQRGGRPLAHLGGEAGRDSGLSGQGLHGAGLLGESKEFED